MSLKRGRGRRAVIFLGVGCIALAVGWLGLAWLGLVPSWQRRTEKPTVRAILEEGEPYARSPALVIFSPDGKTLASSLKNGVQFWDVETGKKIATLKGGHTSEVSSIAFSPDGKVLVSGGNDKTIKLWDASTKEEIQTLKGHTKAVCSVAISPDSKTLASGSFDGTINLWDVAEGKTRATLKGKYGGFTSAAVGPDWTFLASTFTGGPMGSSPDVTSVVELWDLTLDKKAPALEWEYGGWQSLHTVVFSPDGNTVAAGGGFGGLMSGGSIGLWELASRKEVGGMATEYFVYCLAFSPDGKALVSGSQWGAIHLWDVASRKELARFGERLADVISVAFSPNGKILASGYEEGRIVLWDIPAVR